LAVFWASWCNPCKRLRDQFNASSTFEEFIERHQDVKRYAINVDECEEIMRDYKKITVIPATMVFVNGNPVYTEFGCKSMSRAIVPSLERAFSQAK